MKRRKRPSREDIMEWLTANGRWSTGGPRGEPPIRPPISKPSWQAAAFFLQFGVCISAVALAIGAEQLSQGNTIILVMVAIFLIWAILMFAAAIRMFRAYRNYKNGKS